MNSLDKLILNGPIISAQLLYEFSSDPIAYGVMDLCEELTCLVILDAMENKGRNYEDK